MSLGGLATRAIRLIQSEGIDSVAWRTAKWLGTRFGRFSDTGLGAVHPGDIEAVDWTEPEQNNARSVPRPPGGYRVAWIISPPSASSGGHQNAFRFMAALEAAGHQLTVYLYSPQRYPRLVLSDVRHMLSNVAAYPSLAAEIRAYDPTTGIADEYDAVIASDWATAYAARRAAGGAKRFYFVQDFEPAFYAWGSDSVAAENSYRLGLHGFTAGPWLAKKLASDYHMSADYYPLAVDPVRYARSNAARRTGILFYVRPPTPRRATEFGLLAIRELARRRPDIDIHLVGWDMSGYRLDFAHTNHGILGLAELAELYNQCAAALLLSLSNPSLLPLEVMAAGVVPVVNDGENTRAVFAGHEVSYVPLSPRAMAEALIVEVDRPDQAAHSAHIAAQVGARTWEQSQSEFIGHFERAMTRPVRRPSPGA